MLVPSPGAERGPCSSSRDGPGSEGNPGSFRLFPAPHPGTGRGLRLARSSEQVSRFLLWTLPWAPGCSARARRRSGSLRAPRSIPRCSGCGTELPDSLSPVLFPLHSGCRRCKLLRFQSLPWLVVALQSPSAEIPGITSALSGHQMRFLIQIQGCQGCSVLVSPACVSVLFLTVSRKFTSLFAAEALREQQNTRLDLQ